MTCRSLRPLPALLALAGGLHAQTLNLRLVQPDTTVPIVGAFVVMTDSANAEVASGASDATGALTLGAPGAGRYLLQIQRIGYTVSQMRGELSDGQGVSLVLTPTGSRVVSPTIGPATEFVCGKSALEDPDVALLWQQARIGLSLTAMPVLRSRYYFQAYAKTEGWMPPAVPRPRQGDREYSDPWPIWAPGGDPWKPDDFIRNGQSRNQFPDWLGPDPGFFLAEAFLDAYCLRPVGPGAAPILSWADSTHHDWIGIAYRPADPGSPGGSAVQGVIWLDRASLEPRRLEWAYSDLPEWARGLDAGGWVDLVQLPAGGWFAQSWNWRHPAGADRKGSRWSYWQYSGYVYQVQSPSREVVVRFGE